MGFGDGFSKYASTSVAVTPRYGLHLGVLSVSSILLYAPAMRNTVIRKFALVVLVAPTLNAMSIDFEPVSGGSVTTIVINADTAAGTVIESDSLSGVLVENAVIRAAVNAQDAGTTGVVSCFVLLDG